MAEEKKDVSRNEVLTVQWLRGIAALMVVLHHARNPAPWLFNPLEHYNAFTLGVDIFFVISGFIMYVAARHERPLDFIRRRAIRVVPLYWIATLGLLFLSYRTNIFQLNGTEFDHLIRSLLFIPHYSIKAPNQIWPYLIPGWTLNFEMFFYLVFFFSLLFKRPLGTTTLAITVLIGLGFLIPPNGDPILTTYTSPKMLEFVAGVWIGKLYVANKLPSRLVFLTPIGFIGLFSLPSFDLGSVGFLGPIICSSMILTGAVAANELVPKVAFLKGLGDASYSIYLSHTVISLLISRRIVSRVHINGWSQFFLWVVASLAISCLVGYFIHRTIEKPVLSLFSRRLADRRAD
jgi:exopolysaccharide production protein ExoZ